MLPVNTKYGIDAILLGTFIVLSFFLPRLFSEFKLPFFFAMVVYGVYFLFKNNLELFNLSKPTTRFILLYLLYSGVSSYLGFVRNNPCTEGFFRINFIFYMLLYISSFVMTSKDKFNIVIWTCHIASIAISIYTFLFFLHFLGVFKLPPYLLFSEIELAQVHDGFVHITNTNLSMQIFLFPFILLLSLSKEIANNKGLRIINGVAIIAAFSTMLLSGRRAVWMTIAISLLVFFYQQMRQSINARVLFKTFAAVLVFIVIVLLFVDQYDISADGILGRFSEAFSSKDSYNRSNVRFLQMEALFNGFLKFPMFGSGAGIGVADCVRSASGCSYELSYNLILYNSGAIGLAIYFTALAQIFYGLLTRRTKIGNSLALAFICGIIANATNPYFSSSFDFLWWIFIPVFYLKSIENDQNCISRRELW